MRENKPYVFCVPRIVNKPVKLHHTTIKDRGAEGGREPSLMVFCMGRAEDCIFVGPPLAPSRSTRDQGDLRLFPGLLATHENQILLYCLPVRVASVFRI